MRSREQGHAGRRRREGRSVLRQQRYLSAAAMEEVVELGHPEVDVEHLLVALLVTGGPSASRLVAAGVDLAALRRGAREVQEADARALGVHVPAPPAARPGPAAQAVGATPFGGRALELMRSVRPDDDDRALLRALLDDDGHRAERVLRHLGVDVEELRRRLDAPAASLDVALPAAVVDALEALGPAHRRCAASTTHDLPVPADAVWALVGDLRRRPEWDPACVAVTEDEGALRLTYGKGDRRRDVRVLVERTGARSVLWRELWRDDEHVAMAVHVAVQPAGGGSRLRLDVVGLLRSRRALVLRPYVRWASGSRVRWLAQSIARAAA